MRVKNMQYNHNLWQNWMVDYENQVSRRFVELRKTQLKFPIFKCIILRNYCMDCFENLTTSSFQAMAVYRQNY